MYILTKGGASTGLFQCMWSAFSLALRAWVLLLRFGPLLWLYPLTYLSASFKSLWLHLLLKVTESSGPTCIKLGQWASTRRDLFSEEFCTKFSKLHIQVDPHPWDYTKCSLQKAIGEGWEKIFKFDSQEPVGSGCVAQVYKAYVDVSAVEKSVLQELTKKSALEAWQVSGLRGLFKWLWDRKHEDISGGYGKSQSHEFQKGVNGHCDSGRQMSGYPSVPPKRDRSVPVAIKVLHPGLVHQVQRDLFLMKMASRFVELFPGLKWLSLTEIVEEFEKLMIQQIDLRYEARNLDRFRHNFRGMDYVAFPIPLHRFVTRNVLVETFEESEPISRYLHTEVTMELRRKVAKMGIDMLLKMVRRHDSSTYVEGERVAELILHHARANQCKDVERFKCEMAELVMNARSNTIALGKLQVASLLSSVFHLLMTHQVKLESNFASVVFAIMVLEGLGRSLDPELDILKAAKPLLIKSPSSLRD
ncbi:hypothetical protein lerEdw1_018226 [Lerista edwardsae]|nr:hypothetical protein lerEdw1_018226 [Lerista edwardsae]